MPRICKDDRKKLAIAQRIMARRTKGSRNRAKARLRVAMVRIWDRRLSDTDFAVLQRLRDPRCGAPHQPLALRLHQLRVDLRCRQRRQEHP